MLTGWAGICGTSYVRNVFDDFVVGIVYELNDYNDLTEMAAGKSDTLIVRATEFYAQ